MKNKSIIYVNFAPYENAGKTLDYFLDNFNLVLVFTFDFHKLNKKSEFNILTLYKDKKVIQKTKLFKLPTPEFLLFVTLPLIAILICVQTVWHIYRIKNRFGKFDIYFTVNAFTAWIGIILKKLHKVDKTIFWVWDYYPPGYPNFYIKLARWAYWRFDIFSTKMSDKSFFLNKRLIQLRKDIGALPKNNVYKVIPIGTSPTSLHNTPKLVLGHLGVLKKGQGLDIVFDNFKALKKLHPSIKLEVIGSGPDEEYFKNRAKSTGSCVFYGFVKDEKKIDVIMNNWSIGIATYIPNQSNESYWTDPSKIKMYISHGVPVITTNVTEFREEIEKYNAGIVIDYFNNSEFISAVEKIFKRQKYFKLNAFSLAKKYYYKNIYQGFFKN